MTTPPANPFDSDSADPALVAKVEGAYTTMRNYLTGNLVKTVAHGLTRGPAPRLYFEVYNTSIAMLQRGQNTIYGMVDAYATAIVELARLHNEREGISAESVPPLPEWPLDEDPRERARKRTANFLAALQDLCIDHQMVIDVPEVPLTELRDLQADDQNIPLATQLHWCETRGQYAAREPLEHPGYEMRDAPPWWVPDGH